MVIFDLLIITISNLFGLVAKLLPFWFPLVLMLVAWRVWLHYVNAEFLSSLKWTLLEIKIPRDVYKSPLAMELILMNALHITAGTNTWYQKYWQGRLRAWFSLEIASIEGRIHFFIRVPAIGGFNYRHLVEAQVYAQYPQAEVMEVKEDYTALVPAPPLDDNWSMWGTEYKLTKADPYPIKTYVDYGLDKAAGSLEAEEQIDPITSILEFMGAIGEGEQMWFQVLVRASTERYPDKTKWFGKKNIQKVAEDVIKEIMDKYAVTDENGKKTINQMNVPKHEQDTIAAIHRQMAKLNFDVGLRAIYLGKRDKFNPPNIAGLLNLMKVYNSNTLNGFKLSNATAYDYPWQDFRGLRASKLKREMFFSYKSRAFFYPPQQRLPFIKRRIPFVLSTEELATIYHFPGKVLETPSVRRVDSQKSEPPQNLPV